MSENRSLAVLEILVHLSASIPDRYLWVAQQRSAILSLPSVIVGERNYVLNPAHPEFQRIGFVDPVPFTFDIRLLGRRATALASRRQVASRCRCGGIRTGTIRTL
jgi:hypothetical protein